jgi:chemotaxis signal transduction protein
MIDEAPTPANEPGPVPGAVRHLVARRGPLWVGFDVSQVLEVFPLEALARVPRAPAWLVGVLQHQGRPLPVVDLARLAGVAAPAEAHLAVLLDHAEVPLAVVAEAVEAVAHAVPDTECKAADFSKESAECARLIACWQADAHAAEGPVRHGLRAPNGLRFHLLDADRVVAIVMGAVAADGPL